jgi:hypothetical protein
MSSIKRFNSLNTIECMEIIAIRGATVLKVARDGVKEPIRSKRTDQREFN